MGDFLGALAGGGMLLLVGALAAAFLRQMGGIGKRGLKPAIRCAAVTLGMGCAYWLTGALIYQVNFGKAESAVLFDGIFQGGYVRNMFYALSYPSWFAPLSGFFAWMGHLLGRLLFGQYALGGVALSWGMTFVSVLLLEKRMALLWGEETAADASFLPPCLPGGLFFFLPGWPPLALLLAAVLFYCFARRMKPRAIRPRPAFFGGVLAVSACLSAFVTAMAVYGKLG